MKTLILTTANHTVQFQYRPDTTQVLVMDNQDGFVVGFGQVTRYVKDMPNKVVGERFALTRALANLPRSTRIKIWTEYNKA